MLRLHHGDCLDVLPTLAAESIDACVTDPPYHLTAGKKGGSGEASVNLDSPHGRARITAGFMGKQWDGGDVAMRPETWAAVLCVLKPGAYLLAFGGTRTHHRVMCAIEDGGFEIRDVVMWVYGSGFPKGTDKAKIPADWQGWNTALKPAWEPIIVARKPMRGTLAENIGAFGTGAMNIDGCRIAVADADYARNCSGDRGHDGTREHAERGATDFKMGGGSAASGRWPANLIHDGSDEVLALFPRDAGASTPVRGDEPSDAVAHVFGERARVPGAFHGDAGSAARFFYCAKADRADRDEGLDHRAKKPLLWSSGEQNPGAFQSPNTDRSARNHHPTVKPTDLMRYLVRLVTRPGGTVLDPFTGSGSTGKAALLEGMSFVGIEREAEYVEIARDRIRAVAPLFAEAAE